MTRKKSLCRASNGLYVRNIGWKQTPSGYTQHKFYLGRDEQKAMLASLRLEQLWEQVTAFWKALDPVEKVSDRPVWDGFTLTLAEAVRNGESVARVPLPPDLQGEADDGIGISLWLDDVRESYPVIRIELLDRALGTAGRSRRPGLHRVDNREEPADAARACRQRTAARRPGRLRAVDRSEVPGHRKTGDGLGPGPGTAGGVRPPPSPRCTSLRFGLPTNRGTARCPASATCKRGGEASERVVDAKLHQAVSSLLTLAQQVVRVRVEASGGPRTDTGPRSPQPSREGMPGRTAQVQTYSLDELRTLWEYATPFQRLLMLLALNCGFGRAELASLEPGEVLLRQPHPHEREVGCHSTAEDSWVFRVRHKSGVYGEWKLWSETVTAVEWWLRQRAGIAIDAAVTTLLVTRKGHRYDTPTKGNHPNYQIPNSWFHLVDRIRKHHPEFRRLSFNKLRKTAGNLIRSEANGEVAAVFLCHGTPVRSDALLDLYTNRPFHRVFEAIDRVGVRVRPLWAVVAAPFPEDRPKGGPNISPGKIKRIQTMKRQGYKVGYIAEKVGVSTETVRRWAKRSAEPDVLPEAHPPRKVDGDTVT